MAASQMQVNKVLVGTEVGVYLKTSLILSIYVHKSQFNSINKQI